MRKWLGKHLGRQLSNPNGFWGVIVGKLMNISNKPMYHATYELLDLSNHDNILEIGFGNGAFIQEIIYKIEPGNYAGVDLSDTMIKQAKRKNDALIRSGKVQLHKANANNLPFDNNFFNSALTVNTIYFWDSPIQVMEEVKRVLKPGGKFVISLNTKAVLSGREFAQEKFKLYDKEQVEHLFHNTGFTKIRSTYKKLKAEDVLCVQGLKED